MALDFSHWCLSLQHCSWLLDPIKLLTLLDFARAKQRGNLLQRLVLADVAIERGF
jgi:hypothetical protein